MTDKTTKQVLIDARELIAHEDNWITGTLYQRDGFGQDCFCAIGAIARANGASLKDLSDVRVCAEFYDDANPAIQAVAKAMVDLDMCHFDHFDETRTPTDIVCKGNDQHRDHRRVLKAFDKAIASL